MNLIEISDADDPRLSAYVHVRERDLVGREGAFIAEGEVVLRQLCRSQRHTAQSLLLTQRRVAKLQPILRSLAPDTPIYVVPQTVMDGVAGFHVHRGILAHGRSAPDLGPAEILAAADENAVVLVLLGVSNHDNMGGIFRNAAAFGAAGVLLDPACCDPLYRKAIRVSVGATLLSPFARWRVDEDIVAVLRAAGFTTLSLSPSGAETLANLRVTGRIAVLLGAEGPGLAPEVIRRTVSVRIPMSAGFDSLNVATTSGIVLYHLNMMQRVA